MDMRMLESTKKKKKRYSHSRAKEKPLEDGRRVQSHLKSNLRPTRDAQRVQKNLVPSRTQGEEQ